jgi:RHS repeat-associated protein
VPALEIAHEAPPLVRYIRFHPRHLLGVNDPVGLVSTINPVYTLTLPNGIVTEYGYDSASQLTSVTYRLGPTNIGDLSYSYDAGGRRISVAGTMARTNLPSALTSASYDAANQIATWGGVAFTYDLNGNLISDGVNSYTWNTRNQLSALSGGVSATFQYDGVGRRRGKTVGGTTTMFLYDQVNFVQEQTGGATANLLTGLHVDESFARTDTGGTSTLLADALGSTVALADTSGAVQTQFTFEPFGRTTVSGAATASLSQFTGRENDGSGLYYYRARYYSPQLQRFVSDDPAGVGAGDVNLHAYVGNQPTNATDPSGLWIFALGAGGTATAGFGSTLGGGVYGGSCGGGLFGTSGMSLGWFLGAGASLQFAQVDSTFRGEAASIEVAVFRLRGRPISGGTGTTGPFGGLVGPAAGVAASRTDTTLYPLWGDCDKDPNMTPYTEPSPWTGPPLPPLPKFPVIDPRRPGLPGWRIGPTRRPGKSG